MENISVSAGEPRAGGLKAIVLGGLAAGVLDITAAALNVWLRSGRGLIWTFQSVAGGLYGAQTFSGGYATAAQGLMLHFFIALTAAAFFFAASRKLKFLTAHAILCGVLYGIAVWLVMNLIVLPLTPLKITHSFSGVAIGVLIHVLFVGLPISLITNRFSR